MKLTKRSKYKLKITLLDKNFLGQTDMLIKLISNDMFFPVYNQSVVY